jgi:hypothetical protein
MDADRPMAPEETRERKRDRRSAREERFVRDWAEEIYVELLEAWGQADEGPLPTWADALAAARARTALLTEGLGEWADTTGRLLDRNEKSAHRKRGWRRNAYRTGGPDDWRTWWRNLFRDDE